MSLSAQDEPARLILGAPQMITLDGNGPVDLTYTAAESGVVSIMAQSLEAPGVLDTTLEILGPDGCRMPGGFSDDMPGGAGTDSVIENLFLPISGTYTVRVTSFNGVSQGLVSVSIQAGDVFGTVIEQQDQETVIAAALPAYGVYRYDFTAAVGDVITITVRDTSGTLDPMVTLQNAADAILITNDDHPPSPDLRLNTFDAQIVAFAIPDDGTYTVEVWDFTGAVGTFELVMAWE